MITARRGQVARPPSRLEQRPCQPRTATRELQTPSASTPGVPRGLVSLRWRLGASRYLASVAYCILEDVLTSRREEADTS